MDWLTIRNAMVLFDELMTTKKNCVYSMKTLDANLGI